MYAEKIQRIRQHLEAADAAGIVLSTTDNVLYSSGFGSVMDGWHLIEPIAAVFIPTAADQPVRLFLPEASLISLVVSARGGHPIHYQRLRTFDLLNFCSMARAQDAHLALPDDLLAELGDIAAAVEGPCAADIVQSIADCLQTAGVRGSRVLFDDLRVADRVHRLCGQTWGDGVDVMLASRAIKTGEELALLRASGRVADAIMEFTVGQLGVGKRWTDVEKSVARFMIDHDVDPLPGSPMLFGGSYDLVFRPDLFRTAHDLPFTGGEIAILETQGRYRGMWIDINRTAHIGAASAAYRDQHQAVTEIFQAVTSRLRPGCNSAEICSLAGIDAARRLDPPEKLLLVAHSIGHVPLESPVAYPGTGLHAARDGFTVQQNMVISIDCLYFGSRLGPSHMENVFIVTEDGSESLYQYPLDLAEVS